MLYTEQFFKINWKKNWPPYPKVLAICPSWTWFLCTRDRSVNPSQDSTFSIEYHLSLNKSTCSWSLKMKCLYFCCIGRKGGSHIIIILIRTQCHQRWPPLISIPLPTLCKNLGSNAVQQNTYTSGVRTLRRPSPSSTLERRATCQSFDVHICKWTYDAISLNVLWRPGYTPSRAWITPRES